MKKKSFNGIIVFSPIQKKLLTIMRLSIIITFICTIGLSAAKSYSQVTKISFDL